MAKFAINASGAMLLPSLVQVSESISGSVAPLAMFCLILLSRKRVLPSAGANIQEAANISASIHDADFQIHP